VRLICMDEVSTPLLHDIREPIPAQSSQPKRQDHEYERDGMANIFIGFEPLRGQRFTEVTEQRTRVDWARWVKTLVDARYPDVDLIVLVLDNLNIHSIASLYEAFSPAEAKRLAMKLGLFETCRGKRMFSGLVLAHHKAMRQKRFKVNFAENRKNSSRVF
jgi:hypothetical protein